LSALTFIVIVIGSITIVAQEPITGTWNADARMSKKIASGPAENIQLNFSTRRESGSHSTNGSSYEYSDLQGLTREQTMTDGKVSFRLVREAGTVECEGVFTDGRRPPPPPLLPPTPLPPPL